MVFEAFVDDSGTGHGNVAVLAGFLSTAERWKLFSDRLEDLCEREPRTPDFKMQKANGFRAYWWATRQDLDRRIEDVAKLIGEHATYHVDAVMVRPAYDAIVKGRVTPEIDNPYFLLFYTVILSTAEFMEKANLDASVDFIFDEQSDIGRQCARFYPGIKEKVPERIRRRLGAQPVFRHDKELLPLKAADVLAWQLRRHLDMEQPKDIPHNRIIDDALAMYGVSCQVRPEDLEAFVRDAGHGLMFRAGCGYHVPNTHSAAAQKNPL